MLSSGTLNLKFMKRNQSQHPSKITPKIENQTHTPSTTTTQNQFILPSSSSTDRRQPHQRTSQIDHPVHPSFPISLTILFEDSLIGFPLLSFHRYPNISDPSHSILPAHVGRKSFGDFNWTIQNLGDTKPTSHKRPQPEHSTSQAMDQKRSKTIEAQDSRKSRLSRTRKEEGSKPQGTTKPPEIQSNPSNPRTSTTRATTKTVQVEKPAHSTQLGFQRPYQATTIQSKRIKIDPGALPVAPPNPSPLCSPSRRNRKRDHQAPSGSRSSEPIGIATDDDDQESDDSEAVDRQIELMFQEARRTCQN